MNVVLGKATKVKSSNESATISDNHLSTPRHSGPSFVVLESLVRIPKQGAGSYMFRL